MGNTAETAAGVAEMAPGQRETGPERGEMAPGCPLTPPTAAESVRGAFEAWIGVDPGQRESGVVMVRDPRHTRRFVEGTVQSGNVDIVKWLRERIPILQPEVIAIEDMGATGVPCGHALLDTARWIGQFKEAAEYSASSYGGRVVLITRQRVKVLMGGKDDSGIRQAVLAMFRPVGGGSVPQVGTKQAPGPLYGVSGHSWQALAVCMAVLTQSTMKRAEVVRGTLSDAADDADNPFA